MSQCADAVPALDVVKIFFDTFWIVRDGTTPNTVQTRRQLEGFFDAIGINFGESSASVRNTCHMCADNAWGRRRESA